MSNMFSVHFTDDADETTVDFVQSLLIEIAATPGVDLVTYDPQLVVYDGGVDLPAAPQLENGE